MSRALWVLALVGCREAPPEAAPTTPTVTFEAGSFWSSPLPSDHRLVDGRVDLAGLPNPAGTAIVDQVLGLLAPETGWGTTSGIVLPTDAAVDPGTLPSLHGSVDAAATVFLEDVDPSSPEVGRRIPIRVTASPAGPHGPTTGITVVPLQGVPLRPLTRYAVAVTSGVHTADGRPLVASAALRSLDRRPDPVFGAASDAYVAARDRLPDDVVGLTVFTTGDPASPMIRLADHLRGRPFTLVAAPTLTETHDAFCVFEGRLRVTSYQTGTPPYTSSGGGIAWDGAEPVPHHEEEARFWLTTPRATSDGAWPVAVMVRTGGGGDRPLVDRGVRDADGVVALPGTGPALHFARAGWVGFQMDGPLGGLRNPTGGDEQFLVFNVTNPEALRDNLRQSAAELAAIPDFLESLDFDGSACPDHAPAPLATTGLGLLGHSMGATIAPLVLPAAPAYTHVMLSGAGGSWIENVVHKQSPLEVRPLAEAMLGYPPGTLGPDDPFLSLLQWAGESADPPVHARGARTGDRHFLVFQGIVDTYILPPIANTTNLSFGLDQAGEALDAAEPRLDAYEPLGALQDLVGTRAVALPVSGNQGVTAVVVQHLEDGVEDGHEVMYQLPVAHEQLRCFLRTARDGATEVTDTCP